MNFFPTPPPLTHLARENARSAKNRIRQRGRKSDVPRGGKMDWSVVREKIAKHGMRNSNVLAIAPTATISNIMGTTPCIEPNYKNLFVKSSFHTLQASNIEKSTIEVKKGQRGVMTKPPPLRLAPKPSPPRKRTPAPSTPC